MKRTTTLLGIVFILLQTQAQNLQQPHSKYWQTETKVKLTDEVESSSSIDVVKRKNQTAKIPGTILFSETFANQIPTGWTVTNNAGNSNNWIWSNSAPGGQYSTTVAAINSTSGSNGFMSLPSGLFNTPFPTGGPIAMDTWFTSPAITIPATAAVILSFEQSQRYCCAGTDELVAEVSNDGIVWTTYDAALGRNPNTAAPNPTTAAAELVQLNVSADLANQTTAYVRFRMTGATHYYWMIDDVELIEGAANAMEIEGWSINFSDTSLNPTMYYVPQMALDPITFTVNSFNAGSNTQTNVAFNVDLYQDSTWARTPGVGLIASITKPYGIPVPSLQRDTVNAGDYNNLIDGYIRAEFSISTDSVNQNQANATATGYFVITDTILAKDFGPYVGDAGPGNYVGGGNDGDAWASLMTVGTNPKIHGNFVCNTIGLLVANVATNDGASIQPRIYYWDDTASTIGGALGNPIGSSPFSTTIDTSMFGNWINLPIFPPASIIPGAQYAVGWEQTGGASVGAEFTVARDRNVEPRQQTVTNFVYVNDAAPAWGWVTQVGAIRMHFDLTIGIDEKNSESTSVFSVSPNPNNGQFKLNINSDQAETYQLNVRNMLGQVVYTDNISVNGQKVQDLDLSGVEKGVYFVSLNNGSERITKKVIIK